MANIEKNITDSSPSGGDPRPSALTANHFTPNPGISGFLSERLKVFTTDKLNPAPYNPRTITDEALEGLEESITTFNYLDPIIVNIRDDLNVIVGGHQRYKIFKKYDVGEIECITVDLDKEQEKALNVTLNNHEISGRWDLDKLEPLLAELHVDVPNFMELQLEALESSLNLNAEDFSDFDEEDKDAPQPTQEEIYVVELEFLPEDYELFMEVMKGEEIAFKSPSKRVQYGMKLAQYMRDTHRAAL